MKKVMITVLILALVFFGAMFFIDAIKEHEKEKSKDLSGFHDYTNTVVVDGCEYIVYQRVKSDSFFGMAHKGKCKNCIKKIN